MVEEIKKTEEQIYYEKENARINVLIPQLTKEFKALEEKYELGIGAQIRTSVNGIVPVIVPTVRPYKKPELQKKSDKELKKQLQEDATLKNSKPVKKTEVNTTPATT